MTLTQKTVAVLTQRDEPMTYRVLTDVLWSSYPDLYQHMLSLCETEQNARSQMRVRLGTEVKNNPGIFTATRSEGVVLVGLAANDVDAIEDIDEEESVAASTAKPAVYWYTFPAYQSLNGSYPIKIGRGNDPLSRISQQVTAMPEQPVILGTFEHGDSQVLERALHCILTLRGKRKKDAPGSEWFITTPDEVRSLVKLILGDL